MANNYMNDVGLKHLLTRLGNIFATIAAVATLREETDKYVIEVDYNELAFNSDIVELEE